MRIVVTDVTRMNADRACCVAGVEAGGARRIRPVLDGLPLTRDLLAPDGPFALGAVVDLGAVRDAGSAPMVEDRLFEPRAVRRTGALGPDGFWRVIASGPVTRLHGVFGIGLKQPRRGNAALPDGAGPASLGWCVLREQPEICVSEYGRVRMRFTDRSLRVNAPVTDIRFFDGANRPRPDVVERVAGRIAAGARCVLGVGLGRAHQAQWDTRKRHWLQVNGVHLADDPLWTVSR